MLGIFVLATLTGCLLAPNSVLGQPLGDYSSSLSMGDPTLSGSSRRFVQVHGPMGSRTSVTDVHREPGFAHGSPFPVKHVQTRDSQVVHSPGMMGPSGIGYPGGVADVGVASGGTVDLVPGRRPGTVVESVHIPLPAVRQTSHVDPHGVHGNFAGGPSLHVETEHGLPGAGGVPVHVPPVMTPVRRRAHIDPVGRHGNFQGGPTIHVETEHSVTSSGGHVMDPRMTSGIGPASGLVPVMGPHMMTSGIGPASGLVSGTSVKRVSQRRSHEMTSSHIDPPFVHGNPHQVPAEHVQTNAHSKGMSRSSIVGPSMLGGGGVYGPRMIGETMVGAPRFHEGPLMEGRIGRRGRTMFRNIADRYLGA